jgi:hypothetical protein
MVAQEVAIPNSPPIARLKRFAVACALVLLLGCSGGAPSSNACWRRLELRAGDTFGLSRERLGTIDSLTVLAIYCESGVATCTMDNASIVAANDGGTTYYIHYATSPHAGPAAVFCLERRVDL